MLQLPPLSLYIHIPWCIRKCPYCDFNSHKADSNLPELDYVSRLLDDFSNDIPFVQNRSIQSIFIGGGTPSLFSAKSFDHLLNQLQRHVTFDSDIEITLEANPSTFEQEKFSDYRKLGINRLSIGVQSFNHKHLQALGRVHSSAEARTAITVAQRAGFDNINIDLMHGLPGQDLKQALTDIKQALSYEPQHLSWYQLTIEPNTEFYSKPPTLPEEETLWDIQQQGQALLETKNFQQYEISAYSQPHKQSKHNLNYWLFGDYIGIGAGAHGKITDIDQQTVLRYRKVRQPNHYLQPNTQLAIGHEAIPQDQMALEFFMNAYRLNASIDKKLFEARTGLSSKMLYANLELAFQQELLENPRGSTIQTTAQGRRYLNNLLALF